MGIFDSLTQQSHPWLWMIFHSLIGAPRDKQRIALSYLPGRRSVLEIGSSLGVVAEAFRSYSSIQYLGIDIDEQAVRIARKRFRAFPHIEFQAKSLETVVAEGQRFDYVLFGNILHHVDDRLAADLLKQAAGAVAPGGIIVVMEPDILHAEDTLLIRALYRLERGEHRRPLDELVQMAQNAGIRVIEHRRRDCSIGMLPGVVGGHMLVLTGSV